MVLPTCILPEFDSNLDLFMYTLQLLISEEHFKIFPAPLSDNNRVLSCGSKEKERWKLMSVFKGVMLLKVCDCLKSSLYNWELPLVVIK